MTDATAPRVLPPGLASLHCLWAKLGRSDSPSAYHPLICHLIDVGVAAEAVWRDAVSAWAKKRITTALSLPDDEATGRWLAFITATHDVGKACPPFQFRHATPACLRTHIEICGLFNPANPLPDGTPVSHGAVSQHMLQSDLVKAYGLPEKVAGAIAMAVGGHHGRFHGTGVVDGFDDKTLGDHPWTEARRTLREALAVLFDPPVSTPPRTVDNAAAMWLAGFVSVADWIGSNKDYFTYFVPDMYKTGALLPTLDPIGYMVGARATVEQAMTALGWKSHLAAAAPLPPLTLSALFPFIKELAPVQEKVAALAVGDAGVEAGPTLVVIEAPMGEGKTEAALYLADHWASARGQTGSYVGLPSQATSNQMFGRVRTYLESRYKDKDAVLLQLLHGHADLSAEFRLLKEQGAKLFTLSGVDADGDPDFQRQNGRMGESEKEPSVVAAEWFTRRKQGLLAPFGVGTVDQALMAVLSSKHVFVRLFGLGGKVVVIDEVHAYDTYMSVLLARLLAWLGALGCSVVLLSATLPTRRRDELIAAFIEGATGTTSNEQAPIKTALYPRVAWVETPGAVVRVEPVTTSARSCKDLRLLHLTPSETTVKAGASFTLATRLRAGLAEGGCAAVICNTVGRAQEVYAALAADFAGHADAPDLALLHARMPYEQRQDREQKALIAYGRPDGKVEVEGKEAPEPVKRPCRSVLVSTQIIEQSLDLDFDLMVSDLAPIDLLLQRIGRLHRHHRERPAGLTQPTLWLCDPEVDGDSVPLFAHRETSIVYSNHVLLRTWLLVRDRSRIVVPGDIDALIEVVYGDVEPDVPGPAWRLAWEHTLAKLENEKGKDEYQGKIRVIFKPKVKKPLDKLAGHLRQEDAPELHPAAQAVTRLALPSIGLICLWGDVTNPSFDREGKKLYDITHAPDVMTTECLLRRSLTVTHFGLIRRLGDPNAPGASAYLPAGWKTSSLLRPYRLLVFDPRAGSAVVGTDDNAIALRLEDGRGLLIGAQARQPLPDEEEGE
jgi:CRISPR-associated endonuclease/helicase Cas3